MQCSDYSPPTKANRVRFPAESLLDLSKWESCRTMPLIGGFSLGSPGSPALAFRRCSKLTSFHTHRFSRPRWAGIFREKISRQDTVVNTVKSPSVFNWLKHVLVRVICLRTNQEGSVSKLRNPTWLGQMSTQHERPVEFAPVAAGIPANISPARQHRRENQTGRVEGEDVYGPAFSPYVLIKTVVAPETDQALISPSKRVKRIQHGEAEVVVEL
ncbi:hypothetical protein PR048_007795 [Dryococelus australis]|uniref:Uncharacterized protein n=1 Tax=Dryococelus australis TaxID=614101 RepID=A0ABQ9HWW2_9NEOP|nr:hypothetical protein PR048_007795 [Dryococelus australis]